MTVGMSAPPIGMISRTPKSSDRPIMTGNSHHTSGRSTSATPDTTAMPSSDRLMKFWPL